MGPLESGIHITTNQAIAQPVSVHARFVMAIQPRGLSVD